MIRPLAVIIAKPSYRIFTMGRRSDHSREELQSLILEATLDLVKEHGAEKVTARQIAQAIGYTPGTLYSVFINLQDIFLHVNELGLSTLFEQCAKAMSTQAEPFAAIRSMGIAYLEFATKNTHQFDLMFARADSPSEEAPAAIQTRIRSMFDLIEEQLKILNPDATTAQVKLGARALWSGVHGTATLRLSDQLYLDSSSSDSDVVDMLVNNFLSSWQQP